MALAFADPFDALFRYQRALDQQLESGWLATAAGCSLSWVNHSH